MKKGYVLNSKGIMQQAAEQHLKKWLENERKKPMVVRGARQVGKSTLVGQLARILDLYRAGSLLPGGSQTS